MTLRNFSPGRGGRSRGRPSTFYAEPEYEVRTLKSLNEKNFLYFVPELAVSTLLSIMMPPWKMNKYFLSIKIR